MPNLSINIDNLPQSLKDIVEIVGLPEALKLVSELGGTRFYIPKDYKDDHKLLDNMSKLTLQKLINHYGGEIMVLPVCKTAIREARDWQVIHDADNTSLDVQQLALKYGVTSRTIQNILARRGNLQPQRVAQPLLNPAVRDEKQLDLEL